MSAFKLPVSVPQDLLLIQDLVGEIQPTHTPPLSVKIDEDEDIGSSGSECDSENEVAADLTCKNEDSDIELPQKDVVPSDSSSDSDSDSNSDTSEDVVGKKFVDEDLEEEAGPAAATSTYFHTKNEVLEVEPVVPTVEEVGPDEVLEAVGEILSVVGNVVIVKGLAAGLPGRASDRALDTDTLLVFDDRKVLGFIYETFGPTNQPMYQIKFSQKFALDPERVKPLRQVFHLPNRSNFVFLSQIKQWKGSDASNVHDEEPGDDELEFSDDEQEATFKSQKKRKRGESRAGSVASSRHATPNPSQMRDQDMIDDALLSTSAYAERGPYDVDFNAAGPSSRPAPIPYDDPYSTEYSAEVPDEPEPSPNGPKDSDKAEQRMPHHQSPGEERPSRGAGRGRGRGRGRGGNDRPENRRESGARGRGRGRGWGERGRGSPGGHHGHESYQQNAPQSPERGRESAGGHHRRESYQQNESQAPPRSMSPTSLAIARATGQFGAPNVGGIAQHAAQDHAGPWQHTPQPPQAQPQYNFGVQQPFVQPHINPRFASQFGMNFGYAQPPYYPQNAQYGANQNPPRGPDADRNWTDEWTVYGGGRDGSAGGDRTS